MIDILMPRLSDTMEEGAIAVWRKQPGDEVAVGDILVEIESDKATMEYEAYEAGVLHDIVVREGEQASIGTVIAHLDDGQPNPATPAPNVAELSADDDAPEAHHTAAATPAAGPAASQPADLRLLATPLVRRVARDNGIELTTIAGSGPGGRIVRADLDELLAARPTSPEPLVAPTPADSAPADLVPSTTDGRSSTAVAFDQTRAVISRRLAESSSGTPHFSVTVVADVDSLLALRSELNAQLEASVLPKISVNDLVVRASAIALRLHPGVNASYSAHGKGATLLHERVNIGIAVASEAGLVVPVIRDAIEKTTSQIAMESAQLVRRAQARQLANADLVDGTFTISNLGMFGVEQFTAIINPPQGAILAVGAARAEPIAVDGAVEIRARMRCTLSADHRIIDGVLAARFLATLVELLEHPLRIVA